MLLVIGHGGSAQDTRDEGVTFALRPKENFLIHVFFEADKKADIKVRSEKDADVDLYIHDPGEKYKAVASDAKVGKDCNLTFTPAKSQFYLLRVENLGPGDNKGRLSYTGSVKVPSLEPVSLKDNQTATYQITFAANKPASICVDSDKEIVDVDLFVYDEEGKKVAEDQRLTNHCFVTFTPAKAASYKVEVVNLGPGETRCTLRHTGEKAEKK
jgi:hypothetical protein